MTNCPNCNAPIKGQRCEYCGTVFEKTKAIENKDKLEDNILNYINKLEFEAKRIEAMVKYSQICQRQLNEIYEDHNAWNDALATIVWACAGIPFVLLIVDVLRGILGA